MNWRLILLGLVALGLAVLAIATWGSVGSAVCILCILSMCSALLVKKFLINRDDSPFDSE